MKNPFSFLGRRNKKPSTRKELGVSSLVAYGGVISSGEKDSSLTGTTKHVTYSNLLVNTTIVAAGVRYFLNLVSKAGIAVDDPADESPRALELRDKTALALTEMPDTSWTQVVRRAAGFVFHGYSIHEWTAATHPAGFLGFQHVNARPQSTITKWDTNFHGRVLGIVQESPQTYEEIYIPRSKIVYLVDKSLSDQPEGLGLYRHIIKAAKRLERYQQLEGYGYETDLRGVPVGHAPLSEIQRQVDELGMSQDIADKMVAPMADFLKNHIKGPNQGLLLDSSVYTGADEALTPSANKQWGLELLKSTGAGHEAINNAIQRELHEIARVLGTEALLLGSGPIGSMALSKDKSNNLALIVDGVMTTLKEGFERDLVKPLFEMNGWPLDLMPKLKSEPIRYQNIRDITGAVQEMASSGVVLNADDEPVKEIFTIMGLSSPEMHDEALSLMGDEMPKDGPGAPSSGDPGNDIGKPEPKKVNR